MSLVLIYNVESNENEEKTLNEKVYVCMFYCLLPYVLHHILILI